MEIVSEIISKNNGNEHKEMFQKVNGAIFCTACGSQFNKEIVDIVFDCPLCGGHEYLKGEFAETLAGYLKLYKDSPTTIRNYYRFRTNKKSKVTMNVKLIIIYLLIKDGFLNFDDKEKESVIRKTMWKRF